MSDEQLNNAVDPMDDETSGEVAEKGRGTNDFFRTMMDRNFLDYASYVIGSRAIPDVDDGLKPVQRRIMWTLYQAYENGRTTKTANIVGNAMHYHPHGDASIGDAIVVLANKGGCREETIYDAKLKAEKTVNVSYPYFIKTQGNFGNLLTGDRAAAARYTECSLSLLAYETMFNNDITDFVPNYDGRKKEPVLLPAKVPSLLMLGSDGIAVGMSTTVLPHNFNELIDAEIAELKGESFQLYPDFQQGGLMDVREYDDGNGRITLRAKIDIDGRVLVIREIPATCTTETLVESIEKAWKKNKIKISNVQDFTTDRVEIRVTPTKGQDPEKVLQGLYMYTDCSVRVSPKMMVICDRKPVQMTVTQVLKRNVQKLLGYIRREFEIELERLNELRHAKTLAQIFFENRIYKRIEECKSVEEEYQEVLDGLTPFRKELLRDVTKEDVDKLLALPVRRIARFDIEKNQKELREIADKIKEIKHHLTHLVEYTIGYLESLKEKFGTMFPRRTEIEQFEQIDRTKAALNNIKIGWERKTGYIGTAIKSDDTLVCNEFDRFICLEKSGKYRIIPLPAEKKVFIGKMYDFRRYDASVEFGVIYREKKSGKYYGKRTSIGGFILERDYAMCPEGCSLELFTPRSDAIYMLTGVDGRGREVVTELNLMTLPTRSPKARGLLITGNKLSKITHQRYLTDEEMAEFLAVPAAEAEPDDGADESISTEPAVPAAEVSPEVAEPVKNVVSEPAGCTEVQAVQEAPGESTETASTEVAEELTEAEESTKDVSAPADNTEEFVDRELPESEEASEDAVPETSGEDNVSGDELLTVEKTQPVKKENKKTAEKITSASDSEEDFGIVQPEFGF